MKKILVTGAAGFIGSVVTEQLVEQGYDVIALDSLKNGHRAAIHPGARFVQVDLLDNERLEQVLHDNPVEAVVHLAAEALIDESIRNPGRFFRANICGGVNLLEAMAKAGVKRIVFSSSAAVYGEPVEVPVQETATLQPVNSYGYSKLAFEQMLPWYQRAYGLKHISLRYFNACGATARCGENHVPETHIIPILFDVAQGQRQAINLYGADYDTPDGSCIRDYVHVLDIASAHLLALNALDSDATGVYNMGNGMGYSNREVIQAVSRVTHKEINFVVAPRRPGDPARLVASSQKIRQELGWQPRFPDLDSMIETAWRWRLSHPTGYAA